LGNRQQKNANRGNQRIVLYFVIISLLFCLAAIFFQDWKFRHIHILFPIIIFIVSFYQIIQVYKGNYKMMVLNLFFFLFTLTTLTVYMSIKNKKFLNPFQNYFGLGDLLFYVAITPLFLLKNYILFFILSMVFALLLQFGLQKFIKQDTIPLAGFSALLLIVFIVADLGFSFQKMTLL
jgi:hypothetical protein